MSRPGSFVLGLLVVGCTPPSVAVALVEKIRGEQPDVARVCEYEARAIDDVWNEDVAAWLAGLAATGLPYAEASAKTTETLLGAYADAWRVTYVDACRRKTEEPTWDAAITERAAWCLDDRRAEIAALVDELTGSNGTIVRHAVAGASSLAPVTTCIDAGVLAQLPAAPPSETREAIAEVRGPLLRARALVKLGDPERARWMIEDRGGDATKSAWPPMVAAAHLVEGEVLMAGGRFAEGEKVLRLAHDEAVAAGAWQVAAAAATEQVLVFRAAEVGLRWAEDAHTALTRAGDPTGLGEADILRRRAAIERKIGREADAITTMTRALSLREKALGEHLLVAEVLGELADLQMTAGAHALARPALERAKAIRTKLLGAGHPDVAQNLIQLAAIDEATGSLDAAIAGIERAIAVYEAALGPNTPEVGSTLGDLGRVFALAGRGVDAEAAYTRALDLLSMSFGPDHPRLIEPLVGLCRVAISQSNAEKALEHGERVVETCARLGRDVAACVDAGLALADALWEVPPGRGRDRARAQKIVGALGTGRAVQAWQKAHPAADVD